MPAVVQIVNCLHAIKPWGLFHTPFICNGTATFLSPLCDHKTDQVVVGGTKEAAWLPSSFNSSKVVRYTGRPDVTMDATMVAVKFWACSKRLPKNHRGGCLLAGRSNEAGEPHPSPWSQNGCPTVGQWSPHNRMRSIVNIIFQSGWCFCLSRTNSVPPFADWWCPLSDHYVSIRRPRQPLGHHTNGFAYTLPPLSDRFCVYSCFDGSRKAQG